MMKPKWFQKGEKVGGLEKTYVWLTILIATVIKMKAFVAIGCEAGAVLLGTRIVEWYETLSKLSYVKSSSGSGTTKGSGIKRVYSHVVARQQEDTLLLKPITCHSTCGWGSFLLTYLWLSYVCLYMCMQVPSQAKRGCLLLWSWSWLWATQQGWWKLNSGPSLQLQSSRLVLIF